MNLNYCKAKQILERHLVVADKSFTIAELANMTQHEAKQLPTVRDVVKFKVKENQRSKLYTALAYTYIVSTGNKYKTCFISSFVAMYQSIFLIPYKIESTVYELFFFRTTDFPLISYSFSPLFMPLGVKVYPAIVTRHLGL